MRTAINLRSFLILGFLLTCLGQVPARAETLLVEMLKVNPEWVGTVDASKRLAVTFDVSGDPATLKNISYRWKQERKRYAVEFKLDDRSIEFMIPPGDRNRWYKLEITDDEQLVGTLTGLSRDRQRNFEEFVLLRPVGNAEARVEAETTRALTLMGSAKHCNVPSDFQISDGDGLSATQKRFLGFFSGYWDEKLQHTLLVADITKNGTASVYYAWETYANWDIDDPGCTRFKAKIDDGKLTGTLGNGAKVKYRFSDPDTLEGEYDRKNRITPGTFKRQEVLLRPVGNAEARVEAESAIIEEAESAIIEEAESAIIEEAESAVIKKVRKSNIYEYVGKGPIHIYGGVREKLKRFDERADSSLFFVTRDGSYSYRSWCNYCDSFGDPEFVKKQCEEKYSQECFLYKVGSNFAPSVSGAFRDKVVWDIWYKSAEELERERLVKQEENRRAEEEKQRRVEKEQAREAEIASLKRELEDRRKSGGTADTAILAEVERLKREADEARKALQARKAQEAAEAKIRSAELARLRKEIEDRRNAEAARKVLEAKQAKAREARETEIARLKQEAEKARKVRKTEFARLRKELEEAREAREREEDKALGGIEGIEFGRYHALVIGIANYKYLPKLKTAVNDAKAVARMLTEEYGFRLTLLINPDHREIIDTFDEYRERLGPQDNLLIYYAGHGWLDEEVDRGYWLPVNAKPKRRSGWVSNATITDTLKGLSAKHVMVVADSCYSGTLVRGAGMGVRTRTGEYWKQMAAKWTRVAITSGGLEPVADTGGGKHSPFAKAFLDALGKNTSIMDGTQLFTRMRRPVMIAANQTPQYSDVRQAGHDGGDFLFVRRK